MNVIKSLLTGHYVFVRDTVKELKLEYQGPQSILNYAK